VTLVALTWSSILFGGEIHDAAKDGDLARVKSLLENKPDLVFSKDEYDATPLHYAAFTGRKDVAELLLAKKADVNGKNNNGATPLHMAAFTGQKDVAELLLANKAEVNAKDNNGNTALHIAATTDQKDVAELLRQHSGHYHLIAGRHLVLVSVMLAVPSVVAGLIAKFAKKRNFVPWFFISIGIALAVGMIGTVAMLVTKSKSVVLFGFAVWAVPPIVALLLPKRADTPRSDKPM
jgi:hypothetical protein